MAGMWITATWMLWSRAAGVAFSKESSAPPIDDPFETSGTRPPMPKSAGAAGAEAASAVRAAESVPDVFTPAPAVGAVSTAAPKMDFPFDRVVKMADAELVDALRGLLKACASNGVSDLHLSAGARPFVRKQRELAQLADGVLGAEEALRLNTALLASHQRDIFLERKDLDYALAIDAANRYRVNLMFHKGGAAGSYRMIASAIPELDSLGLRNIEAIRKLLSYHNGLILVTGPVGAGKTTTLAALVAELNEKRRDHVITVEDPIEIVQFSKGCNITQREVGPHTKSFASALKGALDRKSVV